ncbi:MAG: hypothetical protein JKY56_13215 [Kofleriaceae bacterium]|nr:hypothetical protein [Kofleriaceae bacterium]
MDESRLFLAVAIRSGLETAMISPDDLIEFVTMDVLARSLPTALKAQLLTAALAADSMGPILILDTLGIDAFAEHAPVDVLWACIAAAASRELGTGTKKPASPSQPARAMLPRPSSSPSPSSGVGTKRKPNRPSRVRAGATSRGGLSVNPALPDLEDDGSFDVVTRVGGEIAESDIAEEVNIRRSLSDSDLTVGGGD